MRKSCVGCWEGNQARWEKVKAAVDLGELTKLFEAFVEMKSRYY